MNKPLSEAELLAILVEWKRKHCISNEAMRELDEILTKLKGK